MEIAVDTACGASRQPQTTVQAPGAWGKRARPTTPEDGRDLP